MVVAHERHQRGLVAPGRRSIGLPQHQKTRGVAGFVLDSLEMVDIPDASEPEAHYVLVSTRDPDEVEFRSFRIVDGEVTEEPVTVVTSYEASAAEI